VKITEVRVKIMDARGDKLQAFCTITLDDSFVIRDLKIIGGAKGIFVAMPSRKLTDRCPRCGCKNHLRASYCNDCGARLAHDRAPRDPNGRAKLHADVAHPINAPTREVLQRAVIDAFQAELERSKLPGYVPPKLFDDFDDYGGEYEDHEHPTPVPARHGGRPGEARGPSAEARPPLAAQGAPVAAARVPAAPATAAAAAAPGGSPPVPLPAARKARSGDGFDEGLF
jgi:stage V sporulation protein G